MNIRIKEIGYYHPENKVSNQYFLDYYDEQGVDIRGFLKASGRKYRYLSNNPKENALTMAIEATKSALQKANMQIKDLDLIVFVSDTPEYLMPTNAIKIHQALNGDSHTGVYDMNCNCLGMVLALDQLSNMMKSNKNMNNVLIVGSQQLQRYGRKDEPIVYATFGDSACALILEKTDDEKSYFIDSLYYTDSFFHDNVHLPVQGLSNTLATNEHFLKDGRIIHWPITDASGVFAPTSNNIKILLERNNVKTSDIKKYVLSQMVKAQIDLIGSELNEPSYKFPFIGDEYGYTGTTSPILALAKTIENREIKRGDYLVLWSVASGITTTAILLKY